VRFLGSTENYSHLIERRSFGIGEMGHAETAERKEFGAFTDMMSSMGRITSKLNDLVKGIEALLEKDRKRKK
jgi:hypothetical protein